MKINRVVIAPHAAEDMYALVDDIAAYPDFLPWCDRADVQRDGENVAATLGVRFGAFATAFSTRNQHTPRERISMRLAEGGGPLKSLAGEWRFAALDERRCRIVFDLQYEFGNPLMALAAGRAFAFVFQNFVDRFIARANQRAAQLDKRIAVEIVRAADAGASARQLRLAAGATVADALAAARLQADADAVSVFGQPRAPHAPLADGDRIELNAPLPNPPQAARRARAGTASGTASSTA